MMADHEPTRTIHVEDSTDDSDMDEINFKLFSIWESA